MHVLSRISFLVAVIIIASYLWAGRSHWYSELEREAELGNNPLHSEPINIAQTGTAVWEVPFGDWEFREGEAHVALTFDRVPQIPRERYRKDEMSLKVRFGAYAVGGDGSRTNRRIRNWYFTTDDPLSPDARMWVSGGTEYGLGGVWIYPFEELYLELEILEPDTVLGGANPRLKIFPKHDCAVLGHVGVLRLIRDGGLLVCGVLLLAMTVMYWRLSRFAKRAS